MFIIIGDVVLKNRAFLAPMAGITDLPFRRLAARYGAGLVISEMVASGELLARGVAARTKLELDPEAGLFAVQIAGRETAPMAEAARIAAGQGARIIDINMGCPAKKVTSGWSGAALMRAPDHALRLIEAVTGAVSVPVTVKMRLGWDSLTAPDLARRAEGAGAAMITVHGRTRAQFYSGRADWSALRAVREAVRVPLVVNGDIKDATDARRALQLSGADAVMIGRGAQGAPWVPGLVGAALGGQVIAPPAPAERLSLILEHYEAILALYGRDLGLRVARKHLGWHLERLPNGAALRAAVIRLDTPDAVTAALTSGFAEAAAPAERRAA